MNGWDKGEPFWCLNAEAHPKALVLVARMPPARYAWAAYCASQEWICRISVRLLCWTSPMRTWMSSRTSMAARM